MTSQKAVYLSSIFHKRMMEDVWDHQASKPQAESFNQLMLHTITYNTTYYYLLRNIQKQ